MLPKALDHVLKKDQENEGDAVKRFNDAVAALVKAFKLASGSKQAAEHADEVAFFSALRAGLEKLDRGSGRSRSPDFAIQQLLN